MKIQSNGNNLAVVESSPAQLPTRNNHSAPPADSIVEIVWRQKNVVGIVIGACLVLALLYLLIATRYYSGSASLIVQQTSPPVLGDGTARAQQETEPFLYMQREVLSSTPVIAMTLGTPGIRDLKTFEGQDNLFAFLKNNLIIEVGKKDELLSVRFDTPYREEAQKIVAALVDSYINYQSKQRHSSAAERLTVLQQEKEKRQAELGRKQIELQLFRAQHGLIASTDDKNNVDLRGLELMSKAVMDAQLETIAAKSAWDDVERTIVSTDEQKRAFEVFRSTTAYAAPSASDDAQLRTQMLAAQAALQQYSTQYLPNHPIIRRLRGQIDQLNLTYAGAVYRRWETSKQRELDLQTSFEKQRELAIAHNAGAVEEARLAAEVTRLQTLSDELDTTSRKLELTDSGNAPHIQVLEPPTVSHNPIRPYTWRTLALALLGGLAFGCGAACVRDWYDYRLRSVDEVKATLGITVLGLVPHVSDENSPIARGQKIHIDPQSEAAEAYRSLRTAIHFGTREGQVRSILVTSPERGDGKTTMASNLAISMAQAGRRVLLIDADLRAPMQDLIFGMNGRIGLATVLSGKEESARVIRHTGIENLDLMPAGVAGRNPSELLNSQKFIDLMELLVERYDHVIIDSPPILAVTDARIVAASADATILVLRAGKSNRKLGELSIDGLISVGAKVLGAVVNDIQRRSYRYYGSYERYGYGNNGRPDGPLVAAEDEREYAVSGSSDEAGGSAGRFS